MVESRCTTSQTPSLRWGNEYRREWDAEQDGLDEASLLAVRPAEGAMELRMHIQFVIPVEIDEFANRHWVRIGFDLLALFKNLFLQTYVRLRGGTVERLVVTKPVCGHTEGVPANRMRDSQETVSTAPLPSTRRSRSHIQAERPSCRR